MSIPPKIAILAQRLERELNDLEEIAAEGVRFANLVLEKFPNNFIVVQLFAFLNSSLFFVNTSRRKIQNNLEYFATPDVLSYERIQEAGEDLAIELGRVLETKIAVIEIKNRLENLQ